MSKTTEQLQAEYDELIGERDAMRDRIVAAKHALDQAIDEDRRNAVLESLGMGGSHADVTIDPPVEADNG